MSGDQGFDIDLARAYFDGSLSAVFQMFDRKEMTAAQALKAIRKEQKKMDEAIRAARFKGGR